MNNEINKERKSHNTLYLPICLEVLLEWIVTKFGTWGRPADLSNCAKLFWQSIQGFRFCRGNIRPFPL